MTKPSNPNFDKILWTMQKEDGKLYTTAKNTTRQPRWFKWLMMFLAAKLIVFVVVAFSMAAIGTVKEYEQRNTELSDSLHFYRAAYKLKKLQP